jgi:hypothetical protein
LEKQDFLLAYWGTGISIAALYPVFTGILLKMREKAEDLTRTGDVCEQPDFKTVSTTNP